MKTQPLKKEKTHRFTKIRSTGKRQEKLVLFRRVYAKSETNWNGLLELP